MKLENKIIEFVKHERWDLKKGICLDSKLLEDFGMDGDDACEFFEMFSEKFKVDLTDIKWDKHFGPEGFNPFWIFTSNFWEATEPITIKDLVVSAQNNKWVYNYK